MLPSYFFMFQKWLIDFFGISLQSRVVKEASNYNQV
jgi:hypothetical protein